ALTCCRRWASSRSTNTCRPDRAAIMELRPLRRSNSPWSSPVRWPTASSPGPTRRWRARAMHPAYSVIIFTTASRPGYGLLIGLALAIRLGYVPRDPTFGLVGLGAALALITLGLLTSTVHLGRPERAWRALLQWRTSWLSREGVAAIATYLPAGALGL